MPTISVIVPNYNHARFLRARIQSILDQTYRDFELILLDDGSRDGSVDIIESYRSQARVSHVVLNARNSGCTFRQWQRGLQLARGRYALLAESDDLAEPQLLERLVAPLEADPAVVLAYSQSHRMNADGVVTGSWLSHTNDLDPQRWTRDYVNDGLAEIRSFLVYKNTIPNASAVLFRKDAYRRCGGVAVDVPKCADWLLWLNLLLLGKVAFVATPLNYFRYHPGSVIATAAMPAAYYNSTLRREFDTCLRRVGADPDLIALNRHLLRRTLAKLAEWHLARGEVRATLGALTRLVGTAW